MLDLLLINSPIHDYSKYPRFNSSYSTPVGLLYLATVIRNENFTVEVIDAEYEQLSPRQLLEIIKSKQPKYLGFNVFTINCSIVEKIIDLIDFNALIILGGPHISAMEIDYFQDRFSKAKIFVKNDGELKLIQILKGAALCEIPGIYFREDGRILKNSINDFLFHLDDLPYPNRDILEAEPYLKNGEFYVDISISRGCIFTCSFCAGSCKHSGTSYKRRSIQSIEHELNYLINEVGVKGIEIVDDLPFYRIDDLNEFLDFLIDHNLKLEWEMNFPFLFLRTLKNEHFERLAICGVKRIAVGIESGSYEIRKRAGKNIHEKPLIEILQSLFRNKIEVKGYFIIGFPNENAKQIHETIAFAKELFLNSKIQNKYFFSPRIFIYKPFPKTPMWTNLLLEGYTLQELLSYHDFEIDVEYFNKHAWGTSLKLSELEPVELNNLINAFYSFLENHNNNGAKISI
jgi:anaerobic magnesium-protoporphyrin IX monomethyl ester cyclase